MSAPGDRTQPAEGRGRRALLAALMAAFPAVYLWRVATTAPVPAPLPEPPAAVNLLVVTTGSWPDADALPSTLTLDSLAARAASPGPIFAGSDDAAASAVSLWTGRWVPHHGVVDGSRSLPPGAWTLAAAARASGARTAAFLQTGFATRQGLGGFDTTVEGSELDPATLGALAAEFAAASEDVRWAIWLHLDEPGPAGASLEAALAPLLGALDASGERVDTMTVLTSLTGREGAWMEGAARVPLWVELPTAYGARNRTRGHLSHVDLTALLRQLLHLPLPDRTRGEARLQGRAELLWSGLRGGQAADWVWVEGAFGHVFRRPGLRAQVPPTDPAEIPELDLRALASTEQLGRRAPRLAPEHAGAARAAYLEARRSVYEGAVESVPAPR